MASREQKRSTWHAEVCAQRRRAHEATPRRRAARRSRSRGRARTGRGCSRRRSRRAGLARLDRRVDRDSRRLVRRAAPRASRRRRAARSRRRSAPARLSRARRAVGERRHRSGWSSQRGAFAAAERDPTPPEGHVEEHPEPADDDPEEDVAARDEEHERDEDDEQDHREREDLEPVPASSAGSGAHTRRAVSALVFQSTARTSAHVSRSPYGTECLLAALASDRDRRRRRHGGDCRPARRCRQRNAAAEDGLNPETVL